MKSAGLIGLALVALAAAFAFARGRTVEGDVRAIVLVAREMAFAMEAPAGEAVMNPTIVLRAGERVRLVVTNLDHGMRHDLVVEGLGLRSEMLAFGQSGWIEFTAPSEPGELQYFCSLHTRMMRGRIVIR